ncbi:Hypothetical protein I595_1633 [Croceitalea dokdonensis DOKDO 023]|uniref:Uncharacterized protein n=1 Tax=Croceitalea dokdonensis DOKDO 023 TaxID=1300341 RepID=A0A0P7B1U0_9FLAO|nr:hypothetical protein [Croceitalea dokdonensis]KPM31985.1 Hypothetical protein I595_1633 [Croceitalea dokdonensis DOKDO 023]
MDFDINATDQPGYLDTGFVIDFSSEDAVTGAYIRFKDETGSPADGYFNVPFTTGKKAVKDRKNKLNRGVAINTLLSKQVGEEEIEVLFGETVPTGRFCYEICLYDSSNNISQIVERCVDVSAWGGNPTLVGEWKMDRVFENDIEVEEFDIAQISCDNGSMGSFLEELYEINDWILVLRENGDYFEEYIERLQVLDFDATAASCEAVYAPDVEEFYDRYLGKWTYTADYGLSIVDFAYENELDASENQTYDGGEIYFDGVEAVVVNNELILTETEVVEGETFVYRAIFVPNN